MSIMAAIKLCCIVNPIFCCYNCRWKICPECFDNIPDKGNSMMMFATKHAEVVYDEHKKQSPTCEAARLGLEIFREYK